MRLLIALMVVVTGCFEAPVGSLVTTVSEVTDYGFLATPRDKVDILFMIDDSGSMEPKQLELRRRFPDLIRKLEEIGASGKKASYHIGVVTSDLEAGTVCPRVRADGKTRKGGILSDIGAAEQGTGNCKPLRDGQKFIVYDQKSDTSNLPDGQDLAATFRCMASVGTQGCGLEQPLEAVWRALHDPIPENQGFLRDDALLVVVFLTDEDDCSAPTSSPIFDSRNSAVGPLDSFRCFQHGIKCGDPLMSVASGPGAYSRCEPAGDTLFDIQKYINFFSLKKINGGVKPNPAQDVLVMAIAGDVSDPITVDLYRTQTIPRQPCTTFDGSSCIWQIGHSCRSATDAQWVGDAAVRIQKLVKQRMRSICDSDYSPSLGEIAGVIEVALKNCVDKPFTKPEDPQCTVQDSNPDGSKTLIPDCSRANTYRPCWRVVEKPACPSVFNPVSGREQRASIEIDRAGKPIAPGTSVEIQCATIASQSQ